MLNKAHLTAAVSMAEDLIYGEGTDVEYLSIVELTADYADENGLDGEDYNDLTELVNRLVRGAWYSEINFPPVEETYKKIRKSRGD